MLQQKEKGKEEMSKNKKHLLDTEGYIRLFSNEINNSGHYEQSKEYLEGYTDGLRKAIQIMKDMSLDDFK